MKGGITGYLKNYSCPRCKKNWGYFFKDEMGGTYFCGEDDCLQDDCSASKGIEDKQASMRPSTVIDKMGVGGRYRGATLATCRIEPEDSTKVMKWINKPDNFLIFLGSPGIGKTYFCCAIAEYLENKTKKDIKYTNPRRFYENIQQAIASGKNQYDAVRRYGESEVLIFDDLGSSTCSAWQQEVTFDLIDQRYSANLPTIITSNLTFDEMENSFDKRLRRRLDNDDNITIEIFG